MLLDNIKEKHSHHPTSGLAHPKYRADIDGLRAVAVISVVFYHAFPNLLKGGFIGVDIFFVISGFLISTIIINSLNQNSFIFSEFFYRRIRRIFPALILVLSSCYAFGWFTLLSDEYKQLGKHISSGSVFISNFALWKESGYFDTVAETKPLLHLWSLGIEEQFYIVFPLILFIFWKLRLNLFTAIITLALVSFFLNLYQSRSDGVADFYSPQTRFWELLSGSLLAYYSIKIKKNSDNFFEIKNAKFFNINKHASILGMLLILCGFIFIDKGDQFPGVLALFPVFGAALIIAGGGNSWLNRTLLSNRILVWFGSISFPLYLWHWPLLSFARIIEGGEPPPPIRIFAIVLAIALSWGTYRFIERPLRFGKHEKIKVYALVTLIALLGGTGHFTYKKDGLPFRAEEFDKIVSAAGEWEYPGTLSQENFDGISFLQKKSNLEKSTLFIGDSNIEQFYPRVEELIKIDPEKVNTALFKTGGGCFPVPDMKYDQPHAHCETLMRDAYHIAMNKKGVDTVVIGAQWNGYLSMGYGLSETIEYGSDSYKSSLEKLGHFIRNLVSNDKKVFVILNIPIGGEIDPKHIVKRNLYDFPNIFHITTSGIDRYKIDKMYGSIQRELSELSIQSGAEVINPMDYLCDERCDALDSSGDPIYKDSAHLRPRFVRKNATFIDRTVRN